MNKKNTFIILDSKTGKYFSVDHENGKVNEEVLNPYNFCDSKEDDIQIFKEITYV